MPPLTPYSRTYSFTDYQSGNPSAPLPGVQVDNELENIERSQGEAIDAIRDIRRSDGKLNNGVVTVDSLDAQVAAGVGAGALAAQEAAEAAAAASAASATAAAGSATAASGYAGNALTSRNEASGFADDSAAAASLSQTARDYANKWATEAEDVNVDDGVNPVGRSAYHWSQKAAASAASVGLPSSLTANTIPVTNAGATAREDKTFSELRGLLGVDGDVADRTALKALDTAKYAVAYLLEAGREGHFRWTPGDFSAQITADTAEGIYIKADDVASTAGAWVRHGDANVHHFGGSSSADSAAAIAGMTGVVGFVLFPFGSTLVSSDTTIDFPVFFDAGAYITVASTKTVTITDRVESPRQWIFRGDGLCVLGHDSDSGEDARQVHVSWFGAFPYPGTTTDQAPLIQKAADAMGNLRESVIEFDIGNYTVLSKVTLTRGCCIKGDGTRRTVFRTNLGDHIVFETGGVAAKVTDVQFEMTGITTRAQPWVSILHDDCEVYDVDCHGGARNFVVAANSSRIKNIRSTWSANQGAGSSLVEILSGGGHQVEGLFSPSSSTFAPEQMLLVGGPNQTGAISAVVAKSILHISPCRSFSIRAENANIARVVIEEVIYNGYAGTAPDEAFYIGTEGTANLEDVNLGGIIVNGHPTNGGRLEQNSSGIMQDIMLSGVIVSGATGDGLQFVRTAGTLRTVRVDGSCDFLERATPFSYSGVTSDIKIDPRALPNANASSSFLFSVANDGVAILNTHHSIFAGAVLVTVGTANYGLFSIRAASGPAIQPIIVSANVNSVATALTGMTGTVGKVTVGVDANGIIYVENRLGGAQNISVNVMAV